MSYKIDLKKRIEAIVVLGLCLGCLVWYANPQLGRTFNFTLLLVQRWFPELFNTLLDLF